MTSPVMDTEMLATKETFHLLFRMRSRFRLGLPENIDELKKRIFKDAPANIGDGPGNFDIFYIIGITFARHTEPLTMGEISKTLNVPLSTATRIVDWLVSNNYAVRLTDADDRRVVRVSLTESGHAMYREIDNFFIERVESIFKNFSNEERRNFLELLKKVVFNLEEGA